MEREVICPVCNRLFQQPVQLRCKHHICQEHVAALAKDSGKITCPVCSTITFQVDRGLQVNNNLQVTVDRWQDQQSRSSRPHAPTCGICEEALASKRCKECEGDLCEACVATSHAKGYFKNHTILPISEKGLPEQSTQCLVHPEEKVGFYCSDCSMAVCSHCILLGDHQDHANMPISRADEEQRDMLGSQVERLQQRQKGHQNLLTDLRAVEAKVRVGGEQQREAINREMANLKELIDVKRQQLLSKSLMEEQQKQAQIKAQLDKTLSTLEQINGLLRRSDNLLRVDSEYDFLTLVPPVIQDGMRMSSQVVEAMTQVPTTFRVLSVDAPVRMLNDLDLAVPSQISAARTVPTLAASSATVAAASMASAPSAARFDGSGVAAPPAQTQARTAIPVVVPAMMVSKKPVESQPPQAPVVRTVRAQDARTPVVAGPSVARATERSKPNRS